VTVMPRHPVGQLSTHGLMRTDDDSSGSREQSPKHSPVLQSGRVIRGLKTTMGTTAMQRHKRNQAALVDIREKRVEQIEQVTASARRRLASGYTDRVSPRFLDTLRGDDFDGDGLDGSLDVGPSPGSSARGSRLPALLAARRPKAPNVRSETETQTVLNGGDLRTIGKNSISLGSKRLNVLASVVANNSLLKDHRRAVQVELSQVRSPRHAPAGIASGAAQAQQLAPQLSARERGGQVVRGLTNTTRSGVFSHDASFEASQEGTGASVTGQPVNSGRRVAGQR
jgi:hypothetical protein